MNIRPFQAVYPNLDFVASAESFFDTVKTQYTEHVKNGFFHKTAQEGIYIYQIKNNRRTYTGVIVCADIRDFFEGKIKKHENTIAHEEQNQMQLLISRAAFVKPVLQTYRAVPALETLFSEYMANNEEFYTIRFDDGVDHTFWAVTDGKLIQQIQQLFAEQVPCTYIADGHHRTSTTAMLYERMKDKKQAKQFDQILCVLFPSNELEIHEFNRVIEGLNDIYLKTIMAKISQLFDIDTLAQPVKPTKKHELVMYLDKEWFRLRWKPAILKSFADEMVILDVTLLNEKVLKDILGIANVRSDARIKYVEGPKGWEGIREKISRPDSVAFYLYPVKLEDLMQIADVGQTLPPKSTWFEPRIKNGLIVFDY